MSSAFLLDQLEKARVLSHAIIKGADLDDLVKKSAGFIKKNLLFLRDNKEGKILLRRFTLPLPNYYIENLVRVSINLSKEEKLTNDHVQQAVLSALLCPLRQVVGSCFATAPGIYIQNEQQERFLVDLYDLMMICQLKRTFSGKEIIVPISPTWGGKQTDHPLLRVWEYTIASFSDFKVEFSRWNFYKSLGLDHQEEGGIGHFIYSNLQSKLDKENKRSEKLHQDYMQAVDEVRVSQVLLRQAESYERARMLKSEVEVRAHHVGMCKELRDVAYERAENLSKVFSYLIGKYTEKFQEYFIEIFDAEVTQADPALYEDSPAGFRLVYKYGRSDPLAWTLIQDAKGYVESLSLFFRAIEPFLISECEWKGGEEDIHELTTVILHFLYTPEFLDFATKDKKPWSYISGGNMHQLLQCYYCIEGEIKEEKRKVKNPMDLLVFLLDVMKSLPNSITHRFEKDDSCSLFMYCPVHAFLFKPGSQPFIDGWVDKGFSYTWARDRVLLPGQKAYGNIQLDRESQKKIGTAILGTDYIPQIPFLNLMEFRNDLVENAPGKIDTIDTILFNVFLGPEPLVFADTNWSNYSFAFSVNPATLELDLYRYNPLTKQGTPMTIWNEWDKEWGVLTKPEDLSGSYLHDLAITLKKV